MYEAHEHKNDGVGMSRGVWVVEYKSFLLNGWVPLSSIGVHRTKNQAKLASRALSTRYRVVRVRDLVGGGVADARELPSSINPIVALFIVCLLLWGSV